MFDELNLRLVEVIDLTGSIVWSVGLHLKRIIWFCLVTELWQCNTWTFSQLLYRSSISNVNMKVACLTYINV